MGVRTYLPGLLRVLRLMCRYALRWEDKIRQNLPDGAAQDAFTAAIVACQALEEIVFPLIPADS